MVLSIVMSVLLAGDPVIGCPKGVEKGKVWLFSRTVYINANRILWNEDPTESPEMTDMKDGWHARMLKSIYRTEFGLTDRFTFGFLLTYMDKDIERDVWKKSGDNWIKKHMAFRARGFGDVWVFGLYKILEDRSIFEVVSIGAGVKLDAADDPLVTKGIGSGAKALRFALLAHFDITPTLHNCSALWFEKRGKIRDIEVKNDQGALVEWEKSGNDIGDGFGYKVGLEKALSSDGKIVGVLFFSGWWKMADKDESGQSLEDTKYLEHSIAAVLQYLPLGEEHEHSKIGLGLRVPYKVNAPYSSSLIPLLMLMWTF